MMRLNLNIGALFKLIIHLSVFVLFIPMSAYAQILFDARLDFPVEGNSPVYIATGDFNGDENIIRRVPDVLG